MTRILTPVPTSPPNAPSHSPPDTRYAPGIGMVRKLGYFSIGLGLAELLMPDAISDLSGVRNRGLLQLYGVREIATGIGILASTRPTEWMWGRVAGDILDIATVLSAGSDRQRTLGTLAALGGVTMLDALCATQLTAAAALEG